MFADSLAIPDAADLIYGRCPHPLTTRNGLEIGGGTVYPELNFTLPAMDLSEATWPKVRWHYQDMVDQALKRAVELGAPGVVIEYETLPPMTSNPVWAEEITRILVDALAEAKDRRGLPGALRVTPNDNRELTRPPKMRSGEHWEAMMETFHRCAAAGGELLSIESVGGKEVHDTALTYGDIRQVIFALCVMGVRDMRFLWTEIGKIAAEHGAISAGDTACGFGNTAMVLAEKNMIPRSFAAVVRAISAVRSLVAYECGAVGPGKDCGYENAILKVITGRPMSLEGKCAACAHLSPIGNLPMALGDLWSNESVQNVKLLGGMAPTVSMEQLIYDCRLMTEARRRGEDSARDLRDWLVASDAAHDPQGTILTPESCIAIGQTIIDAHTPYQAGRAVALQAVEIIRTAHQAGEVAIADRELPFLDIITEQVQAMPDDEDAFIEQILPETDQQAFVAADYELPVLV
jgi:methanol--5-hydroxybenzimidazolylcobamide Co-methyltransferase